MLLSAPRLFALFAAFFVTADAAKILVLFGFPAKSHVGAYMPLIEELARRGHEMTVLSAFPRSKPLANYTEIIVKDTFRTDGHESFSMFDIQDANIIPMTFFFYYVCSSSCEKLLQEPNMQKLMNSKDKFDLVMYEPFFTECTYGILHKFNAPTIQIFPNTYLPIMGNAVGNPSTISYIPDEMKDNDVSTLPGRLMNFMRVGYVYLFRKLYVVPRMEALMRKYFTDPSLPSIEELEAKTSFLFLHSHPIINHPRPLTPNTIEVAGLHIRGAKKLPQDLQKFMDDAPDGVIYFSLGSNLRSVDMPESLRQSILKAFSRLKQKVLWKWEADTLPGQPANVRLGKWLPQHDVLAHPNLKLFITHGGLMSLQETMYFGVPLIALPVLAEQKIHGKQAENAGFGILLNINTVTEDILYSSIQKVLTTPSYQEKVKAVSAVFRDQPQSPLERAVFWTEYAIRHKGAPHLRSGALKLNFFQYYLLDVIAVLSVGALIISFISFLCLRKLLRCFSKSKSTKSVSKDKKTN